MSIVDNGRGYSSIEQIAPGSLSRPWRAWRPRTSDAVWERKGRMLCEAPL